MAIIKQVIAFARSARNLCARLVQRTHKPTDDEIRRICSRLLAANVSDFELRVEELKRAIRRRLGLSMSSSSHLDAKDELFAFRYVLRPQQTQPTNQPDAEALAMEQSKRRDKFAMIDDIARNERQKMTLLVEHRHILGDISKELIEDNRDLVARTKQLIARSKKSMNKRKSA